MGKTRDTANLISDGNLSVNIVDDRVGIGTTNPIQKLQVVGIISATSYRGDGSQLTGVSVGTDITASLFT